MAAARWQPVNDRQAAIQGDLTVATVSRIRREGRRRIAVAGQSLSVDLSAVKNADSGGLALLVDWLAWAQERHARLTFTNLPPALTALAELSDVLSLLAPGQGEVGASVAGTVAGSAVASSAAKSSGGTSPS